MTDRIVRKIIHRWETEAVSEKVRGLGFGGSTDVYPVQKIISVHSGEFICEINLETLLRPLVIKAAKNKRGKALLGGGSVTVKRRTDIVVERRNVPIPLPKSVTRIED